jgi:hypothetical protein
MKHETKVRWSSYLIELLIVVIGISIAFWLNNMGVESKNKKEKIAYLIDIRSDLRTDSLRLYRNVKNNEAKSIKLSHALQLIKNTAPVDSVLINIIEIGNYDFFSPDNFTLTSLIQSGDLKLIDSEEIKKELLRLLKIYESINIMQQNFLQALDDNYFPMLLTNLDMVEFKATDPNFFYSVEIKNYCAFTLDETSQHIRTYKYAQNQVEKLSKAIDLELGKHNISASSAKR